MFDCPLDLEQFCDKPFVIERPADTDLLATAATTLLAQRGIKVGSSIDPETFAIVKRTLPRGVGLLERTTGEVTAHGRFTTSIIAAAAIPRNDHVTNCSEALGLWRMVGHAIGGADIENATLFAHAMAVQQGLPVTELGVEACSQETYETQGPRRGSISTSLRTLHTQSNKMLSNSSFRSAEAQRVYALVGKFQMSLPRGRHDTPETGINTAVLGDKLYHRLGTTPQLGEAFPSHNETPQLARFEARPYGSAPVGPSHLPSPFNDTSRETAQGVHPDLLQVVTLARQISDTPFEVVPKTGGVRSEALQRKLKSAGKSKAKIGRHTIGHAIDLVPVRKGKIDFKDAKGFEDIMQAMSEAAERLGIPIQWGGNWKTLVDKPHFELDRKVYPAPGEDADPGALKVAFR